ncbi:MAG: DUF4332 domain-containing protein [Geminicoccaceae bacterium]
MSSYPIAEIEGIGASYAGRLTAAGIRSTAALLAACADPKGRKATATKTGIDDAKLLKWANMADLMRIKGVGRQFAELLEAAGVDTVKELKHRKADALAQKCAEVNKAKKLTRAVPNATRVAAWIEQAKALPPALTY